MKIHFFSSFTYLYYSLQTKTWIEITDQKCTIHLLSLFNSKRYVYQQVKAYQNVLFTLLFANNLKIYTHTMQINESIYVKKSFLTKRQEQWYVYKVYYRRKKLRDWVKWSWEQWYVLVYYERKKLRDWDKWNWEENRGSQL